MARVLVSDSLSKEGLEVLEKSSGIEFDYRPGLKEDEIAAVIGDYDGLVIRSGSKVTAKVIEAGTRLKVVGRAGIGVDNVDKAAASRRGIIVMNTPTGNAITTAEHALALLFAASRRIGQADATMKQGTWMKNGLSGRELTGKTLGVIGLGNIGRIVADRAKGLRMHVVAFDPVVSSERAAELGVELVALDELFSRADFITAHTPLTPETKNIVNDASIAKMKDGVILVNCARGGIYDEEAVLRGLESGKIEAAGFDVFPTEPPGLTPLVAHPRVIATPHLGASTEEAQVRVAVEICEQVVAYLTNGTITNAVNVPSISREMAPILGPYVELGRRLGQFLAKVEKIQPRTVTIESAGELASLAVAPVVNATLAGLLNGFFEEPVNPVNAPMLAKDRGVEVRQVVSSQPGRFATLLSVTIEGANGEKGSVAGTLAADRTPRLASWGKCQMDAQLEGSVLVILNEDRPGVIGTIGGILGDAKVNVARMQVGLDNRQARALWALSEPLPAAVLAKIQASDAVQKAESIILD